MGEALLSWPYCDRRPECLQPLLARTRLGAPARSHGNQLQITLTVNGQPVLWLVAPCSGDNDGKLRDIAPGTVRRRAGKGTGGREDADAGSGYGIRGTGYPGAGSARFQFELREKSPALGRGTSVDRQRAKPAFAEDLAFIGQGLVTRDEWKGKSQIRNSREKPCSVGRGE